MRFWIGWRLKKKQHRRGKDSFTGSEICGLQSWPVKPKHLVLPVVSENKIQDSNILHTIHIRFTMKALTIITLLASCFSVFAQNVFTNANYTWNQTNTPNVAVKLGNNAVLGGATFNAGQPTSATGPIANFPGGFGFNSALTLGRLTGLASSEARAVNLPSGNQGSSIRHGVETYWSSGLGVPNLPGIDFVIYESCSEALAVEGVMARARINATNDTWSDWYYFNQA